MEEREKPKNAKNCDNTTKKENLKVINHDDDDDDAPVTKKEVDNETKTASLDKTSRETTEVVGMDENNASKNNTENSGSINLSEPHKSCEEITTLKSTKKEETKELNGPGELKLLKENSLSSKKEIPKGDMRLLNKKESEKEDDDINDNDNGKSSEKDKNENVSDSNKSSKTDRENNQNTDEVNSSSMTKTPPPVPRRQSLEMKVSIKNDFYPQIYPIISFHIENKLNMGLYYLLIQLDIG